MSPSETPLPPTDRAQLCDAFRAVWSLGRNLLVGWRAEAHGLTVVFAPSDQILEISSRYPAFWARRRHLDSAAAVERLLAAGCRRQTVAPDLRIAADPDTIAAVDAAIRAFTVTLIACRAVALFDMVKFSVLRPSEQVMQINSLTSAINSALSLCAEAGIAIDLAMSTTGDGFYVWNRNEGFSADLALYHLAMLAVAHNVLAHRRDAGASTPVLRSCVHFGRHYEYHQLVGGSGQAQDFIVGDVTIEAARMCEAALPRQILLGDHPRRLDAEEAAALGVPEGTVIDTPTFVAIAQQGFGRLLGKNLMGQRMTSLHGFLTGHHASEKEFTIKKYAVVDKHGMEHKLFNARFDIEAAGGGRPVSGGLDDDALAAFSGRHHAGEDIVVRVR